LLLLLLTAGCATFQPGDITKAGFLGRSLHQEDAQFRVEVAVPSPRETKQLFDRRLERKDIQPVWVRVENRGDAPALFLPHAMDHEYFAPLEVAYQYHSHWRPKRNAAMDAFLMTNAMPVYLPAGCVRSGFVFTHLILGRKQVSVALAEETSTRRNVNHTFHVPVPGLKDEHKHDDLAARLRQTDIIECDAATLRAELEKLPRATTDKQNRKEGDPLNLVIIGTLEDLDAFADCHWTRTERVTAGTLWHTLKSYVFGKQYRYSPISHLYYEGRPQDLSLQKVRSSVNRRNHLRLWLTRLRCEGKPVWIGQISRDIGVRLTLKSPSLTTHKINPNVDETRTYLVHDLLLGQTCLWWGYVKGVEPATAQSPRRNLTGDAYFTDGLRAVLALSADPVDPSTTQFRTWEIPPQIMASP
jgi:hypothetical protein